MSPPKLLRAANLSCLVSFLWVTALDPPIASAGSGNVNADGTLDVTINFRSQAAAADTECPELAIQKVGGDFLISWPDTGCGVDCQPTLQVAASLEGPWSHYPVEPSCVGGVCSVTVSGAISEVFFRLLCASGGSTNFEAQDEGTRPNPWTVDGITYTAYDSSGGLWSDPRIEWDDFHLYKGLDVGASLVAVHPVPIPMPARSVQLTLVSDYVAAEVKAYNADGVLVGEAQLSGVKVAETLTIDAGAPVITRVVVSAPDNATRLLKFVWCGGARISDVVGFANRTYAAGFHMIGYPFVNTLGNTLGVLFPLGDEDDGTTLYRWMGAHWAINSFLFGTWDDPNATLELGQGAFFRLGRSLTMNSWGLIAAMPISLPLPPIYYIVSYPQPMQISMGDPAVNFPAVDGDTIYQFKNPPGQYGIYSFFSDFGWMPEPPVMDIGEAFWVYKSNSDVWTVKRPGITPINLPCPVD